MNRRHFIQAALAGGAGLGGLSLASKADTYALGVTHAVVSIPTLPPAFDGYRVGFISDIHIGDCTNAAFVMSAVELMNTQKPDLLLLGGDYILHTESRLTQAVLSSLSGNNCFRSNEDDAERQFFALAEILAHCAAPDGIYGVLGNHDRSSGGRLCVRSLAEHKIQVLVNQQISVRRGDQELEVVGYDDLWTGVPQSFPLSARHNAAHCARIVLSHNPDLFRRIIEKWQVPFELGLAGHTHGGQIKLPAIGALTYNIRDLRFSEGMVALPDRFIFTTRGIGTVVIPLRVNCPPEIALLELRR